MKAGRKEIETRAPGQSQGLPKEGAIRRRQFDRRREKQERTGKGSCPCANRRRGKEREEIQKSRQVNSRSQKGKGKKKVGAEGGVFGVKSRHGNGLGAKGVKKGENQRSILRERAKNQKIRRGAPEREIPIQTLTT